MVSKGKMAKAKGKRGEALAAEAWKALGVSARVGRLQAGGAEENPDVITVPGLHCEVKNCEKASIWKWIEQSESDCGEQNLPVVVYKKNRKDFYITLKLSNLPRLFQLLKEHLI